MAKFRISTRHQRRYLNTLLCALACVSLFIYFRCSSQCSRPQIAIVDLGRPHLHKVYTRRYLDYVASLSEVRAEKFNAQLAAVKKMDALLKPEVEVELRRALLDPVSEIRSKYSPQKWAQLDPLKRAQFYDKILGGFSFAPLEKSLYEVQDEDGFLKSQMELWNEWMSVFSDDEISELRMGNNTVVEERVRQKRQQRAAWNEVVRQQIVNSLRHVEVFSDIFLNNGPLFSPELGQLYVNASARLFPWLSGKQPDFFRLDSKKKRISLPQLPNKCSPRTLNFEGKGVVVSLTDDNVSELIALLSVLRVQSPQFPVQIVLQRHSLSQESIEELSQTATYLSQDSNGNFLASLDLTFVDITDCVSEDYLRFFGSSSQKFLAALFNSFEEMVLMDPDALPFVDVGSFFRLYHYKKSSALFYKGSGGDCQTVLPNVPCHSVDPGLFVLNRRKNLDAIIMAVTLKFFKPLESFSDDFFWMGQEMAGNTYEFNQSPIAAVGETFSGDVFPVVPGHLSDDSRMLLWINTKHISCDDWPVNFRNAILPASDIENFVITSICPKSDSKKEITGKLITFVPEQNLQVDTVVDLWVTIFNETRVDI